MYVGYRHLARVPPRNLHIPVLRLLPPAQLPLGGGLEPGSARLGRHSDTIAAAPTPAPVLLGVDAPDI